MTDVTFDRSVLGYEAGKLLEALLDRVDGAGRAQVPTTALLKASGLTQGALVRARTELTQRGLLRTEPGFSANGLRGRTYTPSIFASWAAVLRTFQTTNRARTGQATSLRPRHQRLHRVLRLPPRMAGRERASSHVCFVAARLPEGRKSFHLAGTRRKKMGGSAGESEEGVHCGARRRHEPLRI
jgi:hypothetical protein